MKIRYVLGSVAALVAVLALTAAACGGDDDDDGGSVSAIRTQKGLTVANIDQFGAGSAESADGDDAGLGAAPVVNGGGGVGADAAISEIGKGGSGFGGPSFLQTAGGAGITVQGFGTATADADSARIEFYFGRYNDGEIRFDEPLPPEVEVDSPGSSSGDDAVELQEVSPITEADLQPVIDALVAAGVSRDDIEFVEQGYYDPYWASATLRVAVNDLGALEGIVNAGTDAANGLEGISLQGSNVIYTVSDCAALQQAALGTAIEDAGDNVQTFAAALGVTAGDMIGASNLSWYPTDGTGCDSYWGYPVLEAGFADGPAEVSAYAQVAITYAMQ